MTEVAAIAAAGLRGTGSIRASSRAALNFPVRMERLQPHLTLNLTSLAATPPGCGEKAQQACQ